MKDSYFTITEAQFITGINGEAIRQHILRGWILAERTNGRWRIERGELLEYAVAKWDEGRLYMMRPECWLGRIEAVIEYQSSLLKVNALRKTTARTGKAEPVNVLRREKTARFK